MSITWRIDGVVSAQTGPTQEVDGAQIGPGTHSVEVIVEDATELVMRDPDSLLVDARSWTLTVFDEECPDGDGFLSEACGGAD